MAEPDPVLPPAPSFFGGNTGLTFEALKHRRAIAQALAARRMKAPQTVGEGMTYFGESLNDALGTYMLGQNEKGYAAQQAALQKSLSEDPAAARLPGEGGTVPPPGVVGDASSSIAPPVMQTSNASLATEPPQAPVQLAALGGAGGTMSDALPPGAERMVAEDRPNPPIVTNDIRPMQVAQAAPSPAPPAPAGAMPGAGTAPTFPPISNPPPATLGRTPLPGDALANPRPVAPTMPPMGERERKAFAIMNSTDDPHTREVAKAVMGVEAQKRMDAHAREVKQYDADVQLHNAKKLAEQKAAIEQPTTEGALREKEMKLQQEAEQNQLKGRLGGRDPEKFFAEMDKDKSAAAITAYTLRQAALARSAIDRGVITGFGANQRIDAQRLQAWGLDNKLSGDVASNTEQMKASLDSMLNVAVQNIQGGDPKVTDADIKIARGQTGSDPTLQLETIKKIIANNERVAREKLNDFEDRRDYYLKGTRAERAYHVPVHETADPRYIDALIRNKDSEADRQEFDRRFGAGAAALEIARAKRRER